MALNGLRTAAIPPARLPDEPAARRLVLLDLMSRMPDLVFYAH